MPQIIPVRQPVVQVAKANPPTGVPEPDTDAAATAAARWPGLRRPAGAWPATAVARFTVACADCHREATRWAVCWQDAAYWLRKAGWQARGHGQWRCARCCAHAQRPQRGRR